MSVIDILRQKKLSVEADLESAVELEEKLGDIRAQIAQGERRLAELLPGRESLARLGREIKIAKDRLAGLDGQAHIGIAEQHRRVVSAAVCMVSNNLGSADMYLRLCGWVGNNGTWSHPGEAPDGLPIAAALRLRLIREAGPLFAGIEQRLSGAVNVQEAQTAINDLLK